ncbi:MAG: DegT/DnrJ/EryC1/StrS family aminotransferase [Bryobacterales bacterium]|nr:DegT/DnrJ/EryC1/StrS family aminotransferase [Bryobacterales bacterium]
MKVPLLDLKPQNLALEHELKAAFERVLHSGQFILGPEVETFEQSVAEVTGTRHALGVSSGTDAILLALMALGIGPGDEVLCPSFTFFATAGCVARAGATPVFVDSCPSCFNLDVADARRRLTARTKAIIPVHLFGQTADMDAVLELAREHNLCVIEDAAQALGAAYHGRPAGSMGDFGTYSFFPSKNLGGFGEGGLLATNDDALAEKARMLRNHGMQPKYFHGMVGGNFRLDALQAALLAVKLPHLKQYSARRRENAAYYSGRLAEAGVALPAVHPHNEHIWNQYTVRVPGGRRDALREYLAARQISTEIYYPVPLHLQECFRSRAPEPLPVCEKLASECVSLPIHPDLLREQQDAVIEAIAGFRRS